MACRKCGSDWVTPRGRDCSRCPHCNKVQRCVERKRGRWQDQETQMPCKHCGVVFAATLYANANTSRAYCSPTCRRQAKSKWRRQWIVAYKQGVRKQQQRKPNGPRPTCLECGKQFNKQQGSNSSNRYCSKTCFFAARASGRQSWDKTNMRKAYWHVGGPYAGAPSVKLMAMIAKAHAAVEWAGNASCRLARKELARPTCQHCGCPCKDGASRFCSYACNKAWRGERQCKCGVIVALAKAHGRAWCRECRLEAERRYRRKYKRELGSHRKKVRKGGGFWNSSVRRSVVLARDKHVCYICKAKCLKVCSYNNPLAATVDMVVPAKKGGDWDYHNLRCACRRCNSVKSDRLVGQLTLCLRK